MSVIKPPVPYAGGKQRLASRIIRHLPPHRHWVEPYCGGLSVLLRKERSVHETVNDVNEDIMTFWRVLRDSPDDLVRACMLTPHSRAEAEAALDRPDNLSEVERARRVWVRLTQGRGGQLLRTGWRHFQNPNTTMGMPDYLAAYTGRMVEAAQRLAGVSLECRPALDIIGTYGRHEGVLLYLDPPYVRGARRGDSAMYADEMTEQDHRDMLNAVVGVPALVAISGYRNPLYDDALEGWDRFDMRANTGAHGPATESLWVSPAV